MSISYVTKTNPTYGYTGVQRLSFLPRPLHSSRARCPPGFSRGRVIPRVTLDDRRYPVGPRPFSDLPPPPTCPWSLLRYGSVRGGLLVPTGSDGGWTHRVPDSCEDGVVRSSCRVCDSSPSTTGTAPCPGCCPDVSSSGCTRSGTILAGCLPDPTTPDPSNLMCWNPTDESSGSSVNRVGGRRHPRVGRALSRTGAPEGPFRILRRTRPPRHTSPRERPTPPSIVSPSPPVPLRRTPTSLDPDTPRTSHPTGTHQTDTTRVTLNTS